MFSCSIAASCRTLHAEYDQDTISKFKYSSTAFSAALSVLSFQVFTRAYRAVPCMLRTIMKSLRDHLSLTGQFNIVKCASAQAVTSILRPIAVALAFAIALLLAPRALASAFADAVACELAPWRHCMAQMDSSQQHNSGHTMHATELNKLLQSCV